MRYPVVLFAATLLAACAGRPTPVAVAVAPPPVALPMAPPAPTPINARLSPAATLWHLRSGLNVAALACRGEGEAATVTAYNALLARHRERLAAAQATYAAEYPARGAYDDAQTQLYNFWAQPRGRDAFCAAAREALTALEVAPTDALDAEAPAMLATLDAPFAPPWIAVDASVFGGAPVRVAAR